MIIPKQIKFNGLTYKVKIVDAIDGGETWGQTTFSNPEIKLAKYLNKEKMEETFIHELLHIAYRATCLNQLDEKQEENIISPWSRNMFGLLKDNGIIK